MMFQYENLGSIRNVGWEAQAAVKAGQLSLVAGYSTVVSEVLSTTRSYVGDLRAGDRMLDVPARTVTLAAVWNSSRWSTTWTAARAMDWIGYDRISLAAATVRGSGQLPAGESLRNYWVPYSGVTRLRGVATRELSRSLSLLLTGDNLFDIQRGEPDNATIVPGRSISVGVKLRR
jgi:iron complex outermembrane receptor protein